MPERDNNIWKPLPADESGFVPHVKRRYFWVGTISEVVKNKVCRVPVRIGCELVKAHPSIPGLYEARNLYLHNVSVSDWVKLVDLEEF